MTIHVAHLPDEKLKLGKNVFGAMFGYVPAVKGTRWSKIGLVLNGARWSRIGPVLTFVWLISLKRSALWGIGVGLKIHLSYHCN